MQRRPAERDPLRERRRIRDAILYCSKEEFEMNKKRTCISIVSPALLILATSCSAAAAVPTQTPTLAPVPAPTFTATPGFPLPEGSVTFEMPPDKIISGHSYGKGETAIILANMSYGGEGKWDPFVEAVDKTKFTTITFVYLQPDYSGVSLEILYILEKLKSVGYKRVVCIGASLGVTACGSIAHEKEMIGLVMIAGPNEAGSLSDVTYPKLFIAAKNDTWAAATQADYENAAEPRELVLYPDTSMHGTDLFQSPVGEQFLKALIDFVMNLP